MGYCMAGWRENKREQERWGRDIKEKSGPADDSRLERAPGHALDCPFFNLILAHRPHQHTTTAMVHGMLDHQATGNYNNQELQL